jgi:hypothetical protein
MRVSSHPGSFPEAMIPTDTVGTKLAGIFGQEAELVSQTYVQTMRALQEMAVLASEQNVTRSQQVSPALADIYAREAVMFASLAQELRHATDRVRDLLDGVTLTTVFEKGRYPCNS